MNIICHRGFWLSSKEQNTVIAFQRAFDLGYGVEFDIRDYLKGIIISHNPVDSGKLYLNDLLHLYANYNNKVRLAINIKSDGLADGIKNALNQFKIDNYFLFDMSVPEMKIFSEKGLNIYSRLSEIEPSLIMEEKVSGVWLDCFFSIWYNIDLIKNYILNEKEVCIVSPELHKREHLELWKILKVNNAMDFSNLSLCTDLPNEAMRYFYE